MFCQILHKTSAPNIEFAIDIPWSEERGAFVGHIFVFLYLRFCNAFVFENRTLHRLSGKWKFGTEFLPIDFVR